MINRTNWAAFSWKHGHATPFFAFCKQSTLRVWTFWIISWAFGATAIPAAGDAPDAASVPSWKQGVSRWTGSGYDLPLTDQTLASGAVGVTRTTSPDTLPYKMPVDPNAVNLPLRAGTQLNPHFIPDAPDAEITPVQPTFPATTQTPAAVVNLTPPSNPPNKKPQLSISEESFEELPPPVTKSETKKGSIGEAIDSGDAAASEQAPLESEVTHWYQYPKHWMRGWNSSVEFGLDGSDGNANTLAIQTGFDLKRKTDEFTLSVDVDYRQASNRDVTTEDNGRFNLDYDRILNQSKWSRFSKFGIEFDKFKAFDLRLNINGGLGYHWIRDDTTTLVTRFGAGASQEIGAPDDDWIAEAVFGIEAERQLTSRQKLKAKVDYFPAWEDFSNFRLVSDFAWEILLDGSENLSLKLAATDRYDSTPQGARPNDVYYSLLLLYKF